MSREQELLRDLRPVAVEAGYYGLAARIDAALSQQTEPAPAQDEREAFESWANRECVCDLKRDQFGVYRSAGVENWWIGWQARATRPAQAEQTEQQPEQSVLPLEPTEAMLDAYWEHTGESVEMRGRVHDRARRLYAAMARAALSATPSPATDPSHE